MTKDLEPKEKKNTRLILNKKAETNTWQAKWMVYLKKDVTKKKIFQNLITEKTNL